MSRWNHNCCPSKKELPQLLLWILGLKQSCVCVVNQVVTSFCNLFFSSKWRYIPELTLILHLSNSWGPYTHHNTLYNIKNANNKNINKTTRDSQSHNDLDKQKNWPSSLLSPFPAPWFQMAGVSLRFRPAHGDAFKAPDTGVSHK